MRELSENNKLADIKTRENIAAESARKYRRFSEHAFAVYGVKNVLELSCVYSLNIANRFSFYLVF